MDTWHKFGVVNESLDSFKTLRTGLAYLRSIDITFEGDKEERQSVVSEAINQLVGDGTEEQVEELNRCYYRATISLHMALLYAGLLHYRRLGTLNPQLKHSELDHVLEEAENCGLLEKMRQVRNSVFHVRPNKKMEALIEEAAKLAIDHKIGLARLQRLLYDFTSNVFSGTEIFQESEEVLMKGFNDALAYYNEHLA